MFEALQGDNFLSNAEELRIKDLDHTSKALEQNIEIINNFINKTERRWALMEAKLKKERLVALAALTKSKLLLAEMEIYIVENVLNNRCPESPKNVEANANRGNSHSTPSSPSSSKKESLFNTYSVSTNDRHHSLTSSGSRSLSPFKSSSKESSSYTPRSKRGSLIKKIDKDLTFKSGVRSKGLKPYSRDNSKRCGYTQDSVVESQPRNSTPRPHTPSQHRNVKEKVGKDKTSTPVVSLDKASTTPINSAINKSLTASIISEFDKSFNKENVLVPKTNAKKQKINPVANIDAYKKCLSNNLHVSHTTPAAKIRLPMSPLHPGDPRKYPNSDTEEGGISKTPMRLPVLGIHWGKPASVQPQGIEEKNKCENFPSKINQVQMAPVLATQNFYFRPISPQYLTQNNMENRLVNANQGDMHTSINSAPVQTVSEHDDEKTKVDNTYNNLSYPSQNSQVHSNKPQLGVDNRHISIPVPPMYNYSRGTGSLNQTKIPQLPDTKFNLSYTQGYEPKVELSTKTNEQSTPTSPPRICFYNSS
ncbi:unnamed protein product [Arctia plantaginis]|uniref:Uncharacterized protein n=1 Tax=Arctia plantaginis TaxID=874455 RepID=A0A8S1BTW0_ARCPL|nr:unnamed protein product [Arctia plantaginis]